jgi:hypothetical protein
LAVIEVSIDAGVSVWSAAGREAKLAVPTEAKDCATECMLRADALTQVAASLHSIKSATMYIMLTI